jgi:hypothetical protein
VEQIYWFDKAKLIKRLTPPRWRTKFNLSWYESLLTGIDYSLDEFNSTKDNANRLLSYNGQTCYLELMLNDFFDPTLRRIKIEHEDSDAVYLYKESEGQAPYYLYRESETGITQTYLYNEDEASTLLSNFDFRVVAPISLSISANQMRANIDKYKLAGCIYTITFS